MCFNQNRQAMPFNNGQLTTQANWLIHNRHTMARHTMAFNKRSTDHTSQLANPQQAHYKAMAHGQLTTQANWHTMAFNKRSTDHTHNTKENNTDIIKTIFLQSNNNNILNKPYLMCLPKLNIPFEQSSYCKEINLKRLLISCGHAF